MANKQTTSFKTTTNLQTGQSQSFRTSYKTRTGLSSITRIQMIGISIIVLGIGSTVDNFTVDDLVETTPNYNVVNDFIPIDDPLNTINYTQYGQELFDNLFNEQSGYIAVLKDLVETGENISICFRDIISCLNRSTELQDIYQDDMLNPQPDSFIDTFGLDRFQTLSLMASSQIGGQQTPYSIYLEMTTTERQYVLDTTTYSLVEENLFLTYSPSNFYLFGFDNPFTEQWQWGYYQWPSIRQTIVNLGV
jgi:hypothetical protein